MGQQGIIPRLQQIRARFELRFLLCQPLLQQGHLRRLFAQHLLVLAAISEGHGRLQSHQRNTTAGEIVQVLGVFHRRLGEGAEETVDVEWFAVGFERSHQRREAQLGQQVEAVQYQLGFKIAGEGVLHQNYRFIPLLLSERRNILGAGVTDFACLQFVVQGDAGKQRAVHHAGHFGHEGLHKPGLHQAVVQPGHFGQGGHHKFQPADKIIFQWAQVATVIQLQKLAAEAGYVHLDGALTGAGLTGQTAHHGLVDFVGKVVFAALFANGVFDARRQVQQERLLARRFGFLDRVHVPLAQLLEPLAHQ